MTNKVLFILAVLCSTLVYLMFDSGRSTNRNLENTVVSNEKKVTNDLNTSKLNRNAIQTENTTNTLSLSTLGTCHSALYVSDVMSNRTQYNNQSLINLLNFYKKGGFNSQEILNILIGSKLYDRTEVETASILFEPPIYMSEKVNKEQLLYNFKQIDKFKGDYQSIANAVKAGELDINMNLSVFYGHPKSIIEFLLENKGTLPDISIFQSLVDSGVPIRPNTILNALSPNVETNVLLLMIKHLPDSERNHHWNEFFNGGFNYSYTSFAAKYSKQESLKIILAKSLGDRSDAINVLLKDKMQYDQRPKPVDILQLAEDNNIFNTKLDMLLEHDIPVDADILSSYLSSRSALKEEQKILLKQKVKNITLEAFDKIDDDLRNAVVTYAKRLKIAQKTWPEFIFSYDPSCKKIPKNSHYRFDNLLEKKILLDLLAIKKATDTKPMIERMKLMGDIYVDWYIKSYIFPNMPLEPKVKADRTNKKFINTSTLINTNIVLGDWSKIGDSLNSRNIPLDYLYRNNTFLIEIGIQERVPQDILFDWFSLGVPIHNSSLDELLAIPEYSEFTIDLLKKGKLINKSHKSVLFQAVRQKNIRLIKLLLEPKFKSEPFNNNLGLTALDWTLLNYSSGIEPLLNLLLKQETHLSSEQKDLLTKLNTL